MVTGTLCSGQDFNRLADNRQFVGQILEFGSWEWR